MLMVQCTDVQELAQHQQGLDEEAQAVLHNNSLAVRMMSSAPLPRKALTEARRKAEASFIPTVGLLIYYRSDRA